MVCGERDAQAPETQRDASVLSPEGKQINIVLALILDLQYVEINKYFAYFIKLHKCKISNSGTLIFILCTCEKDQILTESQPL